MGNPVEGPLFRAKRLELKAASRFGWETPEFQEFA
jgi:hypothetical protein